MELWKHSFPHIKTQLCVLFQVVEVLEKHWGGNAGTVLILLWNTAISPLNPGVKYFFILAFYYLLIIQEKHIKGLFFHLQLF